MKLKGRIKQICQCILAVFALFAIAETAFAQAWEAMDDGGWQILFTQRDEKGILYYQIRWVYEDGRVGHPPVDHAVNCAKRVAYDWDYVDERWDSHKMVKGSDIDPSYACQKYGGR